MSEKCEASSITMPRSQREQDNIKFTILKFLERDIEKHIDIPWTMSSFDSLKNVFGYTSLGHIKLIKEAQKENHLLKKV